MTTSPLVKPPGFTPYPDPSDVFAEDVDRHLRVFHPILSVPAAEIDRSWSGDFHFVLPVEPYDGALGEQSGAFYGPHCGEAWVKLVREGSRYRFAGDWRYFAIFRGDDDEATSFYAEQQESYAEHRRDWLEQGVMFKGRSSFRWIDQLGGHARAGNWSNDLATHADVARWGRRPSNGMREDEEIEGVRFTHPLTEDGRRYRLVGALTGYFYRGSGADTLMLFYDQPSETVMVMLDFT